MTDKTYTTEDLIGIISKLTLKEIVDLVDAMKEEFGISTDAPVAAVAAAPAGEAAAQEQTEFKVVMKSFGGNKIAVIKAIRALLDLGLKEAKVLVESNSPVVAEGVDKAKAEDIKKQLEEAGAEISID
jgi:large subunit ribosomal protein L7/L12